MPADRAWSYPSAAFGFLRASESSGSHDMPRTFWYSWARSMSPFQKSGFWRGDGAGESLAPILTPAANSPRTVVRKLSGAASGLIVRPGPDDLEERCSDCTASVQQLHSLVKVVLFERALSSRSHNLSPRRQAYRAKNHREIPCLEIETGHLLANRSVLNYLEDATPTCRWLPENPLERARVARADGGNRPLPRVAGPKPLSGGVSRRLEKVSDEVRHGRARGWRKGSRH